MSLFGRHENCILCILPLECHQLFKIHDKMPLKLQTTSVDKVGMPTLAFIFTFYLNRNASLRLKTCKHVYHREEKMKKIYIVCLTIVQKP